MVGWQEVVAASDTRGKGWKGDGLGANPRSVGEVDSAQGGEWTLLWAEGSNWPWLAI